MIKKDPSVNYRRVGVFNVGWKFSATRGRRVYSNAESIEEGKFQALLQSQEKFPVRVLDAPEKGWSWWMFEGEFYLTNEKYEPKELRALILEAAHRKARRIQRALSLVDNEGANTMDANRQPIPDDAKILVWQRDGGKCVKCGSKEKLEYDHIIPLSRGGSNTARNIQILCETCNHSKSDSLA
jgi:hypothetical protein